MPAARRPKTPQPAPAIAVFGWYAAAVLPDASKGGTKPGMVRKESPGRAFWAAWWTEDPRRATDPDPDAYGFVEGGKALGEAIGAAYDALRKARGPKVYDISLGASYALAAFREGAPRQRATATDFEAMAVEGLTTLGLGDDATEAELRAAFLARHPDHGGDPGTDLHRLTQLFRAALARVKRLAEEKARVAIRAGAPPKRKLRRPRKGAGSDQGALAVDGGGPRVLDKAGLIAEIERIALGVRLRAEKVAPHVKRALGPISPDLHGFCHVGSVGLLFALREEGVVEARLATGRAPCGGHSWVEVPLPEEVNGVDPGVLIVDITATQMGKSWPRVVVVAATSKRGKRYMRRSGGPEVLTFIEETEPDTLASLPDRWWAATGSTL